MNKRIFALLMSTCVASMLLSACQKKSDEPSHEEPISVEESTEEKESEEETESEEEHKHRFSSDWSYDKHYHWHDAICGHDVVKDKAEHIFEEEVKDNDGEEIIIYTCNVCGYSYNESNSFRIRWLNWDDSLIYMEMYEEGETPVYDEEKYGVPKKASNDAAYRYEFTGWDPQIKPVTGKQNYTAQFKQVENKYTATWKDYDGTILYEEDVLAGQTPVYPYDNPIRPDDGYEVTYSFEGWQPTPGPITEDTVYTAQYSSHAVVDALTFAANDAETGYIVTGYNDTPSGSLIIPATYHDKPVVAIADNAFKNCTLIQTVNLPASLTSIGSYAFSGCTALTAFVGSKLDNVTSFGTGVFKNCSSLVYANNPIYGLTAIPDEMFYGCTSLGEVINGQLFLNVTTIGQKAFYGCTGTEYFNISTTGVNTIGKQAFYGCTSLLAIGVPSMGGQVIEDEAFKNCSNLEGFSLSSSQTAIGKRAFENCTKLAEFINYGTRSLSSIGEYAFANTALVTVDFAPSTSTYYLTSVGRYAFSNCSSLVTFKLPKSVTNIGYGVIEHTPNLEVLEIPFLGQNSNDTSNQYLGYLYGVEKNVNIRNSNNDSVKLTSVKISGNTLTEVVAFAFYGCGDETEIWLPTSVKTIKTNAFAGYYGKSLDLRSTITSIEEEALSASLENLTIPFIGVEPNKSSQRDTVVRMDIIFSSRVYVELKTLTINTRTYPSKSFENIDIEVLILNDPLINYLSTDVFYGITKCKEIRYKGTVSQFSALNKGTNWSRGCPVSKIICDDGNYTI